MQDDWNNRYVYEISKTEKLVRLFRFLFVGLTSDDDPQISMLTRAMRGEGIFKSVGYAPFFVHHRQKILTIDLASSVLADSTYNFIKLKNLDLAISLPLKVYCRFVCDLIS